MIHAWKLEQIIIHENYVWSCHGCTRLSLRLVFPFGFGINIGKVNLLGMMVLTKDTLRMPIRFSLAILLGMIGVLFLNSIAIIKNDNVAAVGLFSCIIAVAGEDISMGPIIHKALQRSIGVCIGGLCGYILLFIPAVLLPNAPEACLLVIPSTFSFIIQWLTKGGWEYGTAFLKKRKAGHMIIQLQIAFGVVYVGSWKSSTVQADTAVIRTLAILVGCFVLFLASLISFPQTSLQVSCAELAASLKSSGKLVVTVCSDKTHGISLQPYDHLGKVKEEIKPDDHVKLLDSIDTKLLRGTYTVLYCTILYLLSAVRPLHSNNFFNISAVFYVTCCIFFVSSIITTILTN